MPPSVVAEDRLRWPELDAVIYADEPEVLYELDEHGKVHKISAEEYPEFRAMSVQDVNRMVRSLEMRRLFKKTLRRKEK